MKSKVLCFIAGVAIGALAYHTVLHMYYEVEREDEEDVKDVKKEKTTKEDTKGNEEVVETPEEVDPEEEVKEEKVHIIGLDEFEKRDAGYEQVVLYYHVHDDTLVDEADNVLHEELCFPGVDLSHMAETSSQTSWFIRNNEVEIDYEVIVLQSDYSAFDEED